jgi:hypothetical protein
VLLTTRLHGILLLAFAAVIAAATTEMALAQSGNGYSFARIDHHRARASTQYRSKQLPCPV